MTYIAAGLFGLISIFTQADDEKRLKIYLDADRSQHFESAHSIEMGIKSAFAGVNNTIQGHQVEFVLLDHRANSARSKMNMTHAFQDPDTLLVVAGMHSPPLIKNRTFINENAMLTLVPWAAGGPITRYPSTENWVFRLSVDDTKAGEVIAGYAIEKKGCRNPHLILEKTPWGESNRASISQYVKKQRQKTVPITWFNWGISVANFKIKLREIIESSAECVIFVGNANDAATLAFAFLSVDGANNIPIYSHWGITGGKFHEELSEKQQKLLDITFIQTCFSFISSPETDASKNAMLIAKKLFPELRNGESLKAPVGFIHAYDLGLILIQALSQIELTQDIGKVRAELKRALENIEKPISGLVKNYKKPFSEFNEQNQDAHEALGMDDYCMAKYTNQGDIVLIQ